MLKKLYEKNQLVFALVWIVAYCLLMSLGDGLSVALGVEKSVSLPVGLLLSAVLLGFLKANGLTASYGLCRSRRPARETLFYLPLVLLLTANLWFGVRLNTNAVETVLYILTMLCVGFLEEVIFRGLLFEAMRKDSERAAILVSSVTFGIGHIINLINGSGAELVPNLLQVVYATAAGFLFVMLYCHTQSLIVPIVTHGLFNALSVFAAPPPTLAWRVVSCLLLTVIAASYAVYPILLRRLIKRT